MAKNPTKLHDPQFQKAQAAAIVQRRIMGDSLDTIAAQFQMSRDTVERRIDYAKRHGLLQDATEKVLDELIPLAHAAYMEALVNGDINAARDVMYGTGILSKNNKAQVAPADTSVEMTLAVYREQRKSPYIAPEKTSRASEAAFPVNARIDAAKDGEIVGEESGEDDLPLPRPEGWPDPEPDEDAFDGDGEDQ